MINLDNTDRRLLELLQEGLPIAPEPYREIADALGIPIKKRSNGSRA